MPAVTHRAAFEVAFDDFAPFYQCTPPVRRRLPADLPGLGGRSPWGVPMGQGAELVRVYARRHHAGRPHRGADRPHVHDGPAVRLRHEPVSARPSSSAGWLRLAGLVFERSSATASAISSLAVAGFATMIIAQYLSMGERHDGDDAGGAGHQLLAGHARHHGQRSATPARSWPASWARLRRLGRASPHAEQAGRRRRWATPCTAWFASPRSSASPARCWAASGPTSRGAASGAGTRRRTAPC